ncbi:MAG: hypothetical protein ABH823_02870 [bacterium]
MKSCVDGLCVVRRVVGMSCEGKKHSPQPTTHYPTHNPLLTLITRQSCAGVLWVMGLVVGIVLWGMTSTQAQATSSSSTSYKITAQAFGQGAAVGSSTSYQVRGVARDLAYGIPDSASFQIGEGFLKRAYLPSAVILGPLITSVEAGVIVDNSTMSLTIYGANFAEGATVTLSLAGQSDITGTSVAVVSSGKITCSVNVASVKAGSWTITVTNTDGRSGSLPSAVVLYDAPVINTIVPATAYNNETTAAVEISGSKFRQGATVTLQMAGETDIGGTSVSVVSAEKITGNFAIKDKTVGRWDVKIINPDGKSGLLSEGFKVQSPALQVTEPMVVKIEAHPQVPTVKAASISYKLSQDAEISVHVYNIRGERIWSYTAPAGTPGGQAGINQVVWDGLTAFKTIAGAGVYIIHVTGKENGQIRILDKRKIGIVR